MRIKASGRSALILATGLWVGFAGLSQAATTADSKAAPAVRSKHVAHHWKKVAHRTSGKTALKSARANQSTDAAEDNESSALPPSVANANAQLASADSPIPALRAMSARAEAILQATPPGAPVATDTQVVSADQLNDVDRTLHESPPPVPPLAIASADPAAPPVMASRNDDPTVWDKTSLIGKIFMAFGVMLTVASAARMFMA
ncbi:MAG: hypothetical protein E7813_08250 [Bradyrhizobium sp.]|nr:MAG: hypothetical protein E7813_08250 [Bradyrhizobium sp.]